MAKFPFSTRYNGGGSVGMRFEGGFGSDLSWPYYVLSAPHEVVTSRPVRAKSRTRMSH